MKEEIKEDPTKFEEFIKAYALVESKVLKGAWNVELFLFSEKKRQYTRSVIIANETRSFCRQYAAAKMLRE